jgi:hypothetical protein
VTRRIVDMNAGELLELVRSRDLSDPEVLSVLRSPYCTLEIAGRIASSRDLLGSDAVRENLTGFPGMPLSEAMNLMGTLSWPSLLAVAQAPRSPPLIRRQAERKLLQRLPKLTPGEVIALARRAHRPLFDALTSSADDRVLVALLDNPRLVENDLVVMLQRTERTPAFYRELARHHRWGAAYGVRRALAQTPGVPLPVALSVLVSLRPGDLRRVAESKGAPAQVRSAAAALKEKQDRGLRGVLRSNPYGRDVEFVECDPEGSG